MNQQMFQSFIDNGYEVVPLVMPCDMPECRRTAFKLISDGSDTDDRVYLCNSCYEQVIAMLEGGRDE